MNMPGLMVGKIKAIAQGIADAWQTLYKPGAESRINKDDIVDTAEYIRSMGYDLIGYGFVPANDLTSSEDYETVNIEKEINEKGELLDDSGNVEGGEAGKYYDKYGIGYTATGDEEGATNSFETAGIITNYLDETDVSTISTYAMTNLRMYTIRNYDASIQFFDFLHDIFVNNDNDWATGLISLWVAKDFKATEKYSMASMGHVTVDPSTKTMHIQKGWFNNELVFDMDGWTGRYGMSLEFLLSLHLATMAPELVSTMARTFDTEVQVYLDEFEKATVLGYYKNKDGEYFTKEQLEDFDDGIEGWIGNKDAYNILKGLKIDSKNNGIYKCTCSSDKQMLVVNGIDKDHEGLDDYNDIVTKSATADMQVILDNNMEEWSGVSDWKSFYNNCSDDYKTYDDFVTYGDVCLEHVALCINAAVNYVANNYGTWIDKNEANTGKTISEVQNQYKTKLEERADGNWYVSDWTYFMEFLERVAPFGEIKARIEKGEVDEYQICSFYDPSETSQENQDVIRISIVFSRGSVDGNFNMKVIAYKEESPAEAAEEKVCSDLEDTDNTKACNNCEKYVQSIRDAIEQIDDGDFKSYVPYIARVIGSWYRDTYFVVPDDPDTAIQDAYDERSDYGTDSGELKLTADNLEYINIDEEYLKKTDEHWTKYEVKRNESGQPELDENGNVQYVLYKLNDDGTIGDEYGGTKEEADKEGIKLVKKADTSKIDSAWSAYTKSTGGSSGYTLYEVDSESSTTIKNATYYGVNGSEDYDEILYYTIAGMPDIEQKEDGRRGITNSKIKKMFKIRQYYIYDGTSEKAEKIYLDWQKVLNVYGDECLAKYDIEGSDFDKKYGDSAEAIKRERAVEWALDDFYYNSEEPTNIFDEDPRNKDLIGNITINKDTLNAFSILENTHTLDADYQYRDFKELIVELNYFDKEDLSDKPKKVFNWIIPGYEPSWPVRMVDKSEEYYGTQIHYDETMQKLKNYYGIETEESEDPEAAPVPVETEDMDLQQLSTATGYTEGLDVISPVTGKVISYGTYERKNTDSEKYDQDREAKDDVGFIQIKVLDKPDIFTESNAPDETNEIENYKILNSFYEEYEDVCDGYIVTIDGIELLDGINSLEELISHVDDLDFATLEPNAVPNLADDDQEEEREKMEKAKVEIPIAGLTIYNAEEGKDEIYIREGTIIGKTIKTSTTTDYSYMRVILRNDELAVQENVENYFDLPEKMIANQLGISADLMRVSDSSTDAEKVRAAVTYLKSQGFTTEAACGIVGNLIQECALDPSCVTGSYRGLAQWDSTEIWPKLVQWMENNALDPNSFEGQMRALAECPDSIDNIYHYDGGKTKYWNDLKKLDNVEQAAEAFCVYYERCVYGGDTPVYYTTGYAANYKFQELNLRKLFAKNAYEIYMGNDNLAIKAGQ